MNIVLERQVWEEVDIFMYLEALVVVVVACPRLHARLAIPLYAGPSWSVSGLLTFVCKSIPVTHTLAYLQVDNTRDLQSFTLLLGKTDLELWNVYQHPSTSCFPGMTMISPL